MSLNYSHYYLKWHPETSAHRDEMSTFYRRILSAYLPENKASSILDVGCGTGLAISALQKLGYQRIKGIDLDKNQIALAQSAGLNVKLVQDSVAFLQDHPETLDLILCLDVLEHISKDKQLIFAAAICRALKPHGRAIFSVPNANSALASRWRYNDWTHEMSFTEHSLDFLLFHAGFQKINVYPAEFVRRPKLFLLPLSGGRHWWAFCFFRLLRRLEMMAELGPEQGRKVPLSLNILAVADRD